MAVATAAGKPVRPRCPPQRRAVRVVANRALGAYRLLEVEDPAGIEPAAGQFAMVALARGWGGGEGERPYLPRAFSYAGFSAGRARFLLEAVGPGTAALAGASPGEELLLLGPLGEPFTLRAGSPCLLVGGGTGVAPLALLAAQVGGEARALVGFRDGARAAAAALFDDPQVATEDGSVGWRGTAVGLLERELGRGADRPGGLWVCGCGPQGLLEALRQLALGQGLDLQLALEAPMACGFGACHGCAVPAGDGAYLRVCTDGPVFAAAALGSLCGGGPAPRRYRAKQPPQPPPARPAREPAGGVRFLGMRLAHPLINGSGTFDLRGALVAFGEGFLQRFPFAAYVSKTITWEERPGNPPPRLFETAAGLINSIGLPNPGLERYLAEELPLAERLAVPLIVNVMANDAERLRQIFARLSEQAAVAAVELNASCPNVDDGLELGADPAKLERVVGKSRGELRQPLVVKLTPNTAAPEEAARAAAAGGADAVSLINTVQAGARTAAGRWLARGGGLSGPAIRPIALGQLERVAAAVDLPLVGIGGVQRAADARALLDAGATLVGVGSESFREPLAAARIAAELGFAAAANPQPNLDQPQQP